MVAIYLVHCNFQSIDTYNGNAMIGMVGKDCVAIATDTRLGVQMKTIDTDFQRIFKIHDHLLLGMRNS